MLTQYYKPVSPVTSAPQPFVLSEGLAPISIKLVAHFLWSDIINKVDTPLGQFRGSVVWNPICPYDGHSHSSQPQKCHQEFQICVQYFGTYMGLIASKNLACVQQLLAYQTLSVQEARWCGGI